MSDDRRRIRILLIDDHALFREGLARLLGAEPDIEVVADCASIPEGLAVLSARPIDVVLLDLDLGDERGFDFLVSARQQGCACPVLVVTAGVSEDEAAGIIAQGAAGIFSKQDSAHRLAEGIRTVASGRAWIDQRALQSLAGSARAADAAEAKRLSQRERQVLRGVFDGLANKEIAARLKVSESSIKATLQQLFQKTGVRTRSQLVRIVLEQHAEDL